MEEQEPQLAAALLKPPSIAALPEPIGALDVDLRHGRRRR
jgi:ABC-type Fe3+/spermidine/putrescine transport system ATPase subunit